MRNSDDEGKKFCRWNTNGELSMLSMYRRCFLSIFFTKIEIYHRIANRDISLQIFAFKTDAFKILLTTIPESEEESERDFDNHVFDGHYVEDFDYEDDDEDDDFEIDLFIIGLDGELDEGEESLVVNKLSVFHLFL